MPAISGIWFREFQEFYVCDKCGSVVEDIYKHAAHHINLTNAASNATRANDRIDEIE